MVGQNTENIKKCESIYNLSKSTTEYSTSVVDKFVPVPSESPM